MNVCADFAKFTIEHRQKRSSCREKSPFSELGDYDTRSLCTAHASGERLMRKIALGLAAVLLGTAAYAQTQPPQSSSPSSQSPASSPSTSGSGSGADRSSGSSTTNRQSGGSDQGQ